MAKIRILADYTDNFVASPANEDIACLVTAPSFPELQKNMESSLREHIDWMREDGDSIPAEFEGELILDWKLTPNALLHCSEEKKESKSWGGARQGAGRKAMDASEKKAIMSIYLRPEQKLHLQEAASAAGVSASEFIGRWLDSL